MAANTKGTIMESDTQYRAIIHAGNGTNTGTTELYLGDDPHEMLEHCQRACTSGVLIGTVWFPPHQISMIRMAKRAGDASEGTNWQAVTPIDFEEP